MTWTDGHLWVLKDLEVEADSFFEYKYVVLGGNQPIRWEQGLNRILDVKLLAHEQQQKDAKLCLRDHFDRYTVNFTMYYPLKDDEYMRINGDPPQLGSWNNPELGPVRMKEAKQEVVWLTGQKV